MKNNDQTDSEAERKWKCIKFMEANVVEFHIDSGIGDFSGDDVNLLRSVELIFAVQEAKDVSMRKATLLEFDGVDARHLAVLPSFKLKTRANKSGRSRQVCI
jgi:hypothetical protein